MANFNENTLVQLIALATAAVEAVESAEREADWNIPTFGPTASEQFNKELDDLHEPLADLFIAISGKRGHASDCRTSDAPAMMPGPCNCDAGVLL